ncbi:MAG: inner membrane-spanning protein YciB [Paracoccaceae bacterium]
MMQKKVDPKLKMALELGPVVLFFIGYSFFKERVFHIGGADYSAFIVLTAAFVVVFIASIVILWRLTGRLSPMQLVTLAVVLFMGGMTVWFNDERFFKMKPTIVYLVFAAVLGFGLVQGKSYLKLVMEEALPMQAEGWMILTKRITAFFAGLAVLNEVIWRNFSTQIWLDFKLFGLTAAMFLFFLTQAKLLERYGVKDAE